MGENPVRVELLAPAGSREAFMGAVNAGADAVYLGGEKFGARAYADNFSDREIFRAIEEAHLFGRKVYLTANILTRETELPELAAFVSELYRAGLDGVIVQDLGVLSALRESCPQLPLHASTQMSVTSSEAVQYLRRLGVTRVVPARELSLKEIALLREEDAAINGEPIEIEAFIHGAMCYSYSGRCLMSSFLGGRSGNRGRCAGTCRLPARILDEQGRPVGPDARKKEVYPLSMKDMCVLQILPELIDAGICSFKIEGRMKKPVYAAGVTSIYRKYIDRCYAWMEEGRKTPWTVEESDLEKLRSLYIRTSLGTGYYHARNGRELVTIGKPGYAGTDAALEEEISEKYLRGFPRLEIRGRAAFHTDEPAELEVTLERDGTAIVANSKGAMVQKASGRPMENADLEARLRKTGDSLFVFSSLDIEADESIFLPVSAVNALRRDALEQLKAALSNSGPRQEELSEAAQSCDGSRQEELSEADLNGEVPGADKAAGRPRIDRGLWALVSDPSQMKAAEKTGCSCILVDGEFSPVAANPGGQDKKLSAKNREKTQIGNKSALKSRKISYIRVLPPVFRVYDREKIRRMIADADREGFSGIMVRTLEELELAVKTGYDGEIIADSSLYTWNHRSMQRIFTDCDRIVSSLELNQTAIREAVGALTPQRGMESGNGSRTEQRERFFDRLVLPVYGRIPMMETAGCVRRTENMCSKTDGFWYLEDRMGKKLPVRCRCGTCSNTIYNAVPLSLHQFAGQGLLEKVPVHLCMFTTETPGQTRRILEYFGELSGDGAKNSGSSDQEVLFTGAKDQNQSRKNNRAHDRGRERGGKKTREQKKGGSRANLPTPPFTEFTNGHIKTGAL